MPFTGDSAKKYKDIITKAKMAVAKANAGQAVTDEKQLAALHELKEQVSNLSILAAEKIINKSLTDEDHTSIIKETINEYGQS